MKTRLLFILLCFSLGLTAQNTIYVDVNVSGGANNGTSWANAYSNLQDALLNVNVGDEVWVAQGTYYPDDGNNQIAGNRDESFHLPEDIIILGGFSGTETSSDQRDWKNNITVLSGDINTPNEMNDNSYNIIKTTNVGNNMILDGFTIEKGNAVKIETYGQRGGAWLNRTTSSSDSSTPTVKNCIFKNNQSLTSAGALFLDGVTGSTVGINLEYCTFKDNISTGSSSGINGSGGAITINTFSGETTLNVNIENCIFNDNSANQNGGAIWSRQNANDDGVINITNSLFYGNIGTGGGLSILDNGVTTYNIVNCTLTENDGDFEAGAGIRVWNGTTATVNIHNSIIWDNTRANDPGNTQLNTQIYAPNSNTTHCIIKNIYSNTNSNSSNDPLFVDALNKNFRVSETSNAIDSGLSTHNNTTYDLDGNERIIGSNIDIGAYEFDSCIGSPSVLYVNASATGANDGSNWSNAFASLQDAINNAFCADEIWVATGTYKPGILETDSFTIPNNMTILGGFNGTETTADERNWAENPTVLSGDLNSSNSSNAGDSHTIITINEDNVILDGFIIENGYADDDSDNTQVAIGRAGAGIYIRNAENININNCIFNNNTAYGNGINNGVGGAIINFGNASTTTTITNSLFYNNTATAGGGAISAESGNLTTVNCTIANNTASHGGGIHIFAGNVTTTNSIFTNNSGSNGNINNGGSNTPVASYCLFFNITSGNNGNIPNNVSDGGNNIENTDPIYIDGYKLTDSSPALDVGDNSANSITWDLAHNNRVSNTTIDIGAYEYSNLCDASIVTTTADNGPGSLRDIIENACENTIITFDSSINGNTITLSSGEIIIDKQLVISGNGIENTVISGGNNSRIFNIQNNSVTIENISFQNGSVPTSGSLEEISGGAIYASTSDLYIAHCQFISNTSFIGGAIAFHGEQPESGEVLADITMNYLDILNTTFQNNNSGAGGALETRYANTLIENTLFAGNNATSQGGGLYLFTSITIATNITVSGNYANDYNGGLFAYVPTSGNIGESFTMTNSVVSGNDAGLAFSNMGQCTSCNITYSLNGDFNNPGTGNLNMATDPLFENPIQANTAPNLNGDYSLTTSSPLVNAGTNLELTFEHDLANNPRVFNTTIDIGAYELQSTLSTITVGNSIFTVYPNPVKNILNIKTTGQEFNYSLYNIQGQEILKANNQTSKTIDVSKLPSGVYMLKLSRNNNSQSFKIIKQN